MAWNVPTPPLETVRFTLRLPTQKNGRVAAVEAVGASSLKRAALWAFEETWTASQTREGLEPCDVIHWLALIASQDRPNTPFMLDRAQRGLPCWEQGELPLGM